MKESDVSNKSVFRGYNLTYPAAGLVITIVIWAIAYGVAQRDNAEKLHQSASQAQRLAVFFEQHVQDIVRYGDSYLKMMRSEYVRARDLGAIRELMRKVPLNSAIASHITIIDATGRPLLVSGHDIKPGTTAKDRAYFLEQKNSTVDALHVSLPHTGRNSGKLIIRLVRRYNRPDGTFGGVIFVALAATHITDFFNALNLGPRSSATLVGTDKRIRARSSYGRLGPGQDISGSRIWKELEKSPTGLYKQLSVVDNITRYYAYRRLSDLPLIVAIGVSTDDISESAGQALFRQYMIALLATILVITTAFLLRRETRISQKLAASEANVRTIVETVLEGIVTMNEDGLIESCNSSAESIFGCAPDELIGQPVSMLSPEAHEGALYQHIKDCLNDGSRGLLEQGYIEVSAKRKGGGQFPAELSIGEMSQGGRRLFVVTIRDISAKKVAEQALFEAKERALVTLQSIGDAVISTNAQGTIDFMNPVAEALTGWQANEAIGDHLSNVFNIVNENTRKAAQDPVERCLAEGKIVGLANHAVLISRAGNEYAIEDSAAPIRSSDGTILGVVLVFKDVTEARQLSQKVSYQASHDALTGLINRHEFGRRLERVWSTAQDEDTENVFCYMDLDKFKLVNDTGGHLAGDELLRQLAQLMQSHIRKRDTIGRLGGDEFGLLMEHCSLDSGQAIVQKLIDAISHYPFIWDNESFNIGISVGMVGVTKGSANESGLMRAADSACYAAKKVGPNRIHLYQEEDESFAKQRGETQWAVRLPRALKENRFHLHYQTIVPVNGTGAEERHHYEVLLRMEDEQGELVLPGNFLPAAERYNLATDIDRWVVTYMFNWLHENPVHLEKLDTCAINLSALSICNEDFLPYIVQELREFQIPPQKICFEITETVAITNLSSATSFIKDLKLLGCRFALDDFGIGLSSFAYLKNLPVDILKIDGLFVKDILDEPIDLAMVKSINEIGQVMGKQTIAEFVENEAILNKLKEIGVDFAQGYGISKPEPLPKLFESA